MSRRHSRHRTRPNWMRRAAVLLSAGMLLPLTTASTWAAFSDEAVVGVGSSGSVGGSYDIAFQDNGVHQGNPEAYLLDTSGSGRISVIGAPATAAVTMNVATLTEITGTVSLKLRNARPTVLPADPGYAAPGADPYAVALFTIEIDHVKVASNLTAAQVNALALQMSGWSPQEVRSVSISMRMPGGLANPYYYNRSLVLGVDFEGMSS